VSALLLRTGLRDLLRRPWQTGLMMLGVALGVAVVVAVDLANSSATRAFALSTEAVTGKASHQIVGGPAGVPAALYTELRVARGLRLSAPVVEGYVRVASGPPGPLTPGERPAGERRVFGVDPFAEAPFRSTLAAGTALPVEALGTLLTQPGAVLLSRDTAGRLGVVAGGTLTVTAGVERRVLQVAGLLDPVDEPARRALDGLLLADIATAQEVFGRRGRLSRIDLILSPEEAVALADWLPDGVALVTASAQRSTVAQLTDAFRLNLTALSLLALAVGMFLIYNTVMFSVVQRRAVLGILRCLGVTGRQLFALIVLETGLVSAAGALAGLALGVLLGRGAIGLVTQTINDLYFAVTVSEVAVDPWTLVKGLALGIGAGVLAAAGPAAEAAGVPPVTVLQRSDLEQRVRRYLPALTWAGLLMIALGAALILLVPHGLVPAFAGLFAALIGMALIVPLLTVVLMRLAGAVLGRLGLLGRMAARTVTNALSRTSVAIAALMVAVAVTIGVTVMIASFRDTVENWLDLTLRADVYISAAEEIAGQTATLDPALEATLRALPGVAATEAIRSTELRSPELGLLQVNASTGGQARDARLFRFVEGDPAAIWERVAAGGVLASEPFVYRHGLPLRGATVTLETDRGPQTFPVVGVYYDYASDQGTLLMSLDVYRRYWDDRAISGLALYLAPGADLDRVVADARAALGDLNVLVQPNRALRASALVIFDRTFAITAALRVLAVVVAFIGVLSALLALQLERTRELATLRALGLTRRQLWRLALLETGLMGATAGLLSIPAGLALAAVLIYVINLRSFGWTIHLTATPLVYAQALGVSIAAALLAAVYPALRLSRLEVATALRAE
jgi:putative ABC transport system permease protein